MKATTTNKELTWNVHRLPGIDDIVMIAIGIMVFVNEQ